MILQVGAAGAQGPRVSEEEVDVQGALVGLVDDQGVVLEQVAVGADLGQQQAVGDELHQRLRRGPVAEADLGAHLPPPLDAQLLGQPPGERGGRHPAGLGDGDAGVAPAAGEEADLGDLGRLARARVPRDDDDGMLPDRGLDLARAPADRQLLREVDGHRFQGPPALGPGLPRAPGALLDVVEILDQAPGRPAARQGFPQPPQPAGQARAVGEQAVAEAVLEGGQSHVGRAGGAHGMEGTGPARTV